MANQPQISTVDVGNLTSSIDKQIADATANLAALNKTTVQSGPSALAQVIGTTLPVALAGLFGGKGDVGSFAGAGAKVLKANQDQQDKRDLLAIKQNAAGIAAEEKRIAELQKARGALGEKALFTGVKDFNALQKTVLQENAANARNAATNATSVSTNALTNATTSANTKATLALKKNLQQQIIDLNATLGLSNIGLRGSELQAQIEKNLAQQKTAEKNASTAARRATTDRLVGLGNIVARGREETGRNTRGVLNRKAVQSNLITKIDADKEQTKTIQDNLNNRAGDINQIRKDELAATIGNNKAKLILTNKRIDQDFNIFKNRNKRIIDQFNASQKQERTLVQKRIDSREGISDKEIKASAGRMQNNIDQRDRSLKENARQYNKTFDKQAKQFGLTLTNKIDVANIVAEGKKVAADRVATVKEQEMKVNQSQFLSNQVDKDKTISASRDKISAVTNGVALLNTKVSTADPQVRRILLDAAGDKRFSDVDVKTIVSRIGQNDFTLISNYLFGGVKSEFTPAQIDSLKIVMAVRAIAAFREANQRIDGIFKQSGFTASNLSRQDRKTLIFGTANELVNALNSFSKQVNGKNAITPKGSIFIADKANPSMVKRAIPFIDEQGQRQFKVSPELIPRTSLPQTETPRILQ